MGHLERRSMSKQALCNEHTWNDGRLAKRPRSSYYAFCAPASYKQPGGATSSISPATQPFVAPSSHSHTSATPTTGADSVRGVGVVTGSASPQEDNGTASVPNHRGEGSLRDVSGSVSHNFWSPYGQASSEAQAATSSFPEGCVWSCPVDAVPLCPLTPPADGAQMSHSTGPGCYTVDVYSSVHQASLHWVGPNFGEDLQHNPLTPPSDGVIEGYGTRNLPFQYGTPDAGLQTDRLHWVGPSFAEDLQAHILSSLSDGHCESQPMSETNPHQQGAGLPPDDIPVHGSSFVDGFEDRSSAPNQGTPEEPPSAEAPPRQYSDLERSSEPLRHGTKRKRRSQSVSPRTGLPDSLHGDTTAYHPDTKALGNWQDQTPVSSIVGEGFSKERTNATCTPNSSAPEDEERRLVHTLASLAALESREKKYAEQQLKRIQDSFPALPRPDHPRHYG
ncbi:hypothetical protein Purlil1_12619 [Purpureocillium lilacinum]|uniref:Uncharacterized protein n=1 Tax=Purpureocillium lilacinum TaxID=33203 RepID=A0ABR0BGC9_PURLI|nr:hypothetical protein Purlil1_12619 [Purpureocillium lilacinum]